MVITNTISAVITAEIWLFITASKSFIRVQVDTESQNKNLSPEYQPEESQSITAH
jgi:hypothetical protein